MAPLPRLVRPSLAAAALACASAPAAVAPAATPRPRQTAPPPLLAGESRLGLAEGRDGLVYVPPGLGPGAAAPLLVFLHGAGGDAAHLPSALRELADASGVVVLAPESRGRTWDVLLGEVGPDLDFLQRALDHVKARVRVDRRRVALAGFSDGASYALVVGLRNGDVFSHVIAFSPGLSVPSKAPPPPVFVSHGAADEVLPVGGAREIVARLRREGCPVDYREFEGGHRVPPEILREAFRWFVGG